MGETAEIETREAGTDRRDNVASAGLDPGTWNELEQWRVDEGITSRSDAVRRLIRDGLDAQTPDTFRQRVLVAASLAVIMLIPIMMYRLGGWPYVAALVGLTVVYVLLRPQIDSVLSGLRDTLPV